MKTIKVQLVIRRALCLACVPLLASGLLVAQQPVPPEQAPAQLLSSAQLDDLVAPIALYPDPLLSQVLVASTYPLEIIEAQQWLQKNGSLTGQQMTDAAKLQNWDASVQAMVPFPQAMAMLDQDIQWTTALGNAFLAQQSDVMAAVQRMRARAESNGRLSTTPQETVTTETQNGQTAIDIAPADPQVIYVPQYDPAYVWGPPVWGYYPPLYYGGLGYGFYPGINIGFYFGGWGGWGFGGWGWGWGPNWFGGGLFVNGFFFNHFGFHGGLYAGGLGRGLWQHDASHRLGVAYPNGRLTARFGAASVASRAAMTSRTSNFSGIRSAGASAGGYTRFGNATSSYTNRPAGTQGAPRAASPSTGRANDGAGRSSVPTQQSAPSAQRPSAPVQHYSAPSGGSAPRSYSGGSVSHSSSSGHSSGGSHGGGRR